MYSPKVLPQDFQVQPLNWEKKEWSWCIQTFEIQKHAEMIWDANIDKFTKTFWHTERGGSGLGFAAGFAAGAAAASATSGDSQGSDGMRPVKPT